MMENIPNREDIVEDLKNNNSDESTEEIEINSINDELERLMEIQEIIRNADINICDRIFFDHIFIRDARFGNLNEITNYAKFEMATIPILVSYSGFYLIIKPNEISGYKEESTIVDHTITLYNPNPNLSIMNEFIQALQNKDFKKVNELFNNKFYLNEYKITEINLGERVVDIITKQDDFILNFDNIHCHLSTINDRILFLIIYFKA